jgi:hypothetical protein
MNNMREMLNEAIAQVRREIRDAEGTQAIVSPLEYTIDTRFQMWMWGGRLHRVLQGWTLPSSHIKDMWNLWQSVTSM